MNACPRITSVESIQWGPYCMHSFIPLFCEYHKISLSPARIGFYGNLIPTILATFQVLDHFLSATRQETVQFTPAFNLCRQLRSSRKVSERL
jgi:hypothetical protein